MEFSKSWDTEGLPKQKQKFRSPKIKIYEQLSNMKKTTQQT